MSDCQERKTFVLNDQTNIEWEQNLTDVLIYIKFLQKIKRSDLEILISTSHLRVALRGVEKPIIHEEFFDTVIKEDCLWTYENNVIEINLNKMRKASLWDSAFKGHGTLDPLFKEKIKKKMTLERFQEEHPGFDFSSAEFSGCAPNPREFMGGISYK